MTSLKELPSSDENVELGGACFIMNHPAFICGVVRTEKWLSTGRFPIALEGRTEQQLHSNSSDAIGLLVPTF